MKLELHHFFILVEPGAEVAELLSELGMQEGERNTHEGQGTSNRRFNFANSTLELLWLHDENEAVNGPGRDMLLAERAKSHTASPFGIIVNRKDILTPEAAIDMPFQGWKYKPVYFETARTPGWAFHIGANSKNLLEPLCVHMPFVEPAKSVDSLEPVKGVLNTVTHVHMYTPSDPMSEVLHKVGEADRLSISYGDEHLMEVTFDNNQHRQTRDLRPDIPLIIYW